MSRILIGTFPAAGHVAPFLPLVRALVDGGHRVAWICTAEYRTRVDGAGARFLEASHVSSTRPEHLTGVAALKHGLRHEFIANAPRQFEDIREAASTFLPDILLCDPGFLGGLFYHELTGVPLALLNVLPLLLSSEATAPFGLGLRPAGGRLGRLRNRALNWAVPNVLFRDIQRLWNSTRARFGLEPTGWMMDASARASLYLQATVPGFEYPRPDLPANVRFIGAIPVSEPAGYRDPEWWSELDGSRPVVHVTQGTVANVSPALIGPALEGLAGEDVLVVVATGGAEWKLEVPRNARVASFLSYPRLLEKTSVVVTNGGYGGTQAALARGIPVVIAGDTEDKPEVSMRVEWSGAGINLKTGRPSAGQVREAVREVLRNPVYRGRARRLQAQYRAHPAITRAVELLEELALSESASLCAYRA